MADTSTVSNDSATRGGTDDRVGGKLDARKDVVRNAAERVRSSATDAVGAGTRAVDQAPLSAVAGAIAFGAVAAALIPATARELSAIGPLGRRLRGLLDEAFEAAKGAGLQHLTTQGLTTAALTSGLGQSIGHLVTAALAASNAASTTVRSRRGTAGPTTSTQGVDPVGDGDTAQA